MGWILQLIIALPKLLDLVEKLIEAYEKAALERKEKILEKAKNDADDSVTKFITRVEASQRLRGNTTGTVGKSEIDESSTNNQCNCSGTQVCGRCFENHK